MMRRLLLAVLILLSFCSSSWAFGPMGRFGTPATGGGTGNITYFGTAANPADQGTTLGPTVAVTPPSSMVAGDLVVMVANHREYDADLDLAISETGGQTWTSEAIIRNAATETQTTRLFWCRFDGTWDADPSVTNITGTRVVTVTMHVFRPTTGSNTWAVDVAQSAAGYAAPSTPYDVTISGITTQTDGAVVVAYWTSGNYGTWTLQTGGWSAGGTDQYRNLSTYNQSNSMKYLIKASAGATGDIVNRQGNQYVGTTIIIAFKEVQ